MTNARPLLLQPGNEAILFVEKGRAAPILVSVAVPIPANSEVSGIGSWNSVVLMI